MASRVPTAFLLAMVCLSLVPMAQAEASPFLPGPRVGDHLRYDVERSHSVTGGLITFSLPANETVDLVVSAATVFRAADGSWHHDLPFQVTSKQTWPAGKYVHSTTTHVDPVQHTNLALAMGTGFSMKALSSGGLGGSQEQSYWMLTDAQNYDRTNLPCGILNERQGTSSPLGPARGAGGCLPGNQALESSLNDNHLVLTGQEGADHVRATFQAGLAYPILVERAFQIDGTPLTETWHLTGFAPGTVTPALSELPHDEPVPAVAMAPATQLGPDATDYAMQFPLATAFEEARSHLTEHGLSDYLAANPDWVLRFAGAFNQGDEHDRTVGWILQFAAPSGGYSLTIGHRLYDAVVVSPLPAWPKQVDEAFYTGLATNDTHMPPRPTQAPTLASAAHAWKALAGSASAAPQVWSYVLECADPACTSSNGQIQVGQAARVAIGRTSDMPIGPIGSTGVSSTQNVTSITVSLDGRVQALMRGHASNEQKGSTLWGDAPPGLPPLQATKHTLLAGIPAPPVVVSAAAAGVGLLALGLFLAKGSLFALFSRVRGTLEPPTRRLILAAVVRQPGTHYQELVRDTGLGKGTLEHHMRVLVRKGRVVRQMSNGYACFFPPNSDPSTRTLAGVLKAAGARSVLHAIKEQPGRSGKDVAEATGLDPSSVSYHVQRLQEAGLITSHRTARGLSLQANHAASA